MKKFSIFFGFVPIYWKPLTENFFAVTGKHLDVLIVSQLEKIYE